MERFINSASRVKEVSVVALGLQKGSERFPQSDDEDAPTIAGSRGNLTGLSHIYNLYFVACCEDIIVYEPQFPYQKLLPGKGSLVLNPPKVRNLGGYMDPTRPHCINHLIVDFLGQEEIVLVCCDDGDVLAYRTRHIQYAIECCQNQGATSEAFEAQPFFKENVVMSAWGLSIHTKSRRIAVSSNTHRVTIFSFALAESDMMDSDDEARYISDSDRPPQDFPNRKDNTTFVLPPIGENIPCVAFCNTGDDPEGRYLVTGDILGNISIWTLQGPKLLEKYSAHYCFADCDCKEDMTTMGTYGHAAWGLQFLDRRSFRKAGPISDMPQNPGMISSPKNARNRGQKRTQSQSKSSGSMDQEHIDFSRMAAGVPRSSSMFWVNDPRRSTAEIKEAMDNASQDQLIFNQQSDGMAGWEPGNDVPKRSSSFVWERSTKHRLPEETEQDRKFPNTPLLQISSKQLFLRQPREPNQSYPTISMHDPLKQFVPKQIQWALSVPAKTLTAIWNRITFHAAIPELGVFVVGAYNGRCGVMSLLQGESDTGETVYFWKMDWLLPFDDQEKKGERPGTYLVGMAVSPLQGMGGRRSDGVARTWRLMLYYKDHSILSYEISRAAPEDFMNDVDFL